MNKIKIIVTCPECGSDNIEREELGKTTEDLPEELFCANCYVTIEEKHEVEEDEDGGFYYYIEG